MVFCDAMDQKLTTSASYPYRVILASGKSLRRNSSGQQAVAPFAVHVDSLSPVRPWMKTMLGPVINSDGQNAIGTFLLNHRIDSVGGHDSEA